MAFRARAVGVGQRVEGQRVDGVPEPAATVNVTVDEIVSGVGIGDVRRVVPLQNGQAESYRGDYGGRRSVLERAVIVDDVPEGTTRRLQRAKVSTSVMDESG